MNTLRRILSHWQHVTALLAGCAIFFLAPGLLRLIDPTAGAFDAGYLLRPVVAAVYLLFGVSAVWTVIAVSFPSVDKWVDQDGFRAALHTLDYHHKVALFVAVFLGLLAAYCVCLWLVPV